MLAESTKEMSAYITHVGLYEFNTLCFGPTSFQKLADNLLPGLGEVVVYDLDDVAVFSDSWEAVPKQCWWDPPQWMVKGKGTKRG